MFKNLFFSLLACSMFAATTACAGNSADNNGGNTGDVEAAGRCGLRFNATGLCGSFTWNNRQTDEEMATLTVRLTTAEGAAASIEPSTLAVVLWMPSMGHGSSPTKVTKVSDGVYRVENVYFSMPGDWEIRFQIKNGRQTIDQAIYSLSL